MNTLCYTQDDVLENIKFVLRNKKSMCILDQCKLLMMLKNNKCVESNCHICLHTYYLCTFKFLFDKVL